MKTFQKEVGYLKTLHCCERTGIAWIEDGCTGMGLSLHPNIDASGSVAGMKSRGYWLRSDRCIKTHSFIYNIDAFAPEGDPAMNDILLKYCRCGGNHGNW